MTTTAENLQDKIAVVTGASSGIGAQIARELAIQGAKALLIGRDEARLNEVVSEISAAGGTAAYLSIDVTEADAPQTIVDESVSRLGGLDILVHAAGVFLPTPFPETTDADLDKQWNVNVRAPFRLTRAAAEHLRAGSAVIFVSSICGHVGFPNSSAYCATKGAVELLVKSLTAEFAPLGIRVNAVAPGNVRTSINAHLLADSDYEKQMLDATPAGRVGEVEDIAPAVAFLASPAASYIHGSSLLIDGGWVAS
ncbi:SDR family NAD(P)-dependent oxidoreductase [Mycolicibacterium septicum]|uniref:SDR family NAD(P)-dependent oxidoreductase n=1 Tax=Mycolicibacterium septicum TaxID=98668 RepID=UPI0023604166|nr:SDR family oxidoreductase [Mycolicibacterium septicum]